MRLTVITSLAVIFELGFGAWYAVMIATLYRSLRRTFDPVTAGMFYLSAARLLSTAWMVWLLTILTAPFWRNTHD